MSAQTTTSQYLVICRGADWNKILSSGDMQSAMKQFYAWFERLSDEGKMRSGHRLAPEGAILSGRKGVTDGPFPESKEAIAGYWFIQAASLVEAVKIAKGNPLLNYGKTVEVRPILPEAAPVPTGEGLVAFVVQVLSFVLAVAVGGCLVSLLLAIWGG
jgi:hypothetical protein